MSINARLIRQEENYVANLRSCLNHRTPDHLGTDLLRRIEIAEWRIRKLRTAA